jgi:hypothetical protein
MSSYRGLASHAVQYLVLVHEDEECLHCIVEQCLQQGLQPPSEISWTLILEVLLA